jgi:RNA polymerase sigma-70 factor (ECF subfamily)
VSPSSKDDAPASRPERRVVPLSRAELSDADLVAGLVRLESVAVAELYDRLGGLVRRVLIRSLGSPVDVDDLLQETFLIVVRRAKEIRDSTALSSFVIGVAIRVAKNELRKRAVRRWVGLEDVDSSPITAPLDAEVGDAIKRVYRVLDRLDASARTLFVLRHVEGMELTELASVHECSLATLKRRLAKTESRFELMAGRDPVLREWLERGRR